MTVSKRNKTERESDERSEEEKGLYFVPVCVCCGQAKHCGQLVAIVYFVLVYVGSQAKHCDQPIACSRLFCTCVCLLWPGQAL
jgi:hypothetical protein